MYGTVARWRLKPGKRDELIALLHRQMEEEERFIPGSISSFLYSLDADPDRAIMVAVFDSKEAYQANARSPGQDARYAEVRALLAEDAEWNDGEIETYVLSPDADLRAAAYGTVGEIAIKPGEEEALEQMTRSQLAEDEAANGHQITYVLRVDRRPGHVMLIVTFDSRESYAANAESPQQHQRYLELRELLAADPVWHDGTITAYVRF